MLVTCAPKGARNLSFVTAGLCRVMFQYDEGRKFQEVGRRSGLPWPSKNPVVSTQPVHLITPFTLMTQAGVLHFTSSTHVSHPIWTPSSQQPHIKTGLTPPQLYDLVPKTGISRLQSLVLRLFCSKSGRLGRDHWMHRVRLAKEREVHPNQDPFVLPRLRTQRTRIGEGQVFQVLHLSQGLRELGHSQELAGGLFVLPDL